MDAFLTCADEVALFARATVISRPADDRAVVDAGSKTLSIDRPWEPGRGFGYLASDPSTRVVRLWEKHGVLGLGENVRGLRVGDRVSIVPNHVCSAIIFTIASWASMTTGSRTCGRSRRAAGSSNPGRLAFQE